MCKQQIMTSSVAKRVREFCELSSLVDSSTNEFYPLSHYECDDPVHGPKLTKKVADWNLQSVEEWDTKMMSEMQWILTHKHDVMNVLPIIKREWPSSCEAIYGLYMMNNI